MKTKMRLLLSVLSLIIGFSAHLMADNPSFREPIPLDQINPRMQTVLQELSRMAQAQPLEAKSFARDKGIPLVDNFIRVIIEPISGRASAISQEDIVALGGKVEATSRSLMRVRVPTARLEKLADQVRGLSFVRLPYRPRPLVVTSQGVALTGADTFHTAGYNGQDTDVAIIDMGFQGLTNAQNAGELDHVVYTYNYTGGGSTNVDTYIEHGTAVAEIVADMAPVASLHLLMIEDALDLQNATDYCITNGIDIINHSVGWYNTNFYDGTGTVANIANDARDNGILWVNAAGNEAADGHWQGAFVDDDEDFNLDFNGGSDYIDEDVHDEGNRIDAIAGDTIHIYMTWDDWPDSDQDYNLYLFNSSGVEVAHSHDEQSGTQPPKEHIAYLVEATGSYEIVVLNWGDLATADIEIFAYEQNGHSLNLEYHHPESTINAPANSSKVLAVGAIYQGNWTTGPLENTSSRGPSNTGLTKPDICGPDGVSNYTYDNYYSADFYGTSAASPHVAGAAALLLSKYPSLDADGLQSALESYAIDMGADGKDNLYGSGRLDLQYTDTPAVFRVESSGDVRADGSYYGTSFETGSADVAEWVSISEPVEPGDVLELDPGNPGHYRKSRGPCSTLVAGVVSTDPGFVLGSKELGSSIGSPTADSRPSTPDSGLSTPDSALLALIGIVPVKVTNEGGPIQPGDLLVSSSTPGHAMRWAPNSGEAQCALVGKALELMEGKNGIVLALLSAH
jgi:subtilisin family serine protease